MGSLAMGGSALVAGALGRSACGRAPDPAAACAGDLAPGQGLLLDVGGKAVIRDLTGSHHSPLGGQRVEFGPQTHFRVASISKLAVAATARALAAAGVLDLDGDVADLLPGGLRHPAFPAAPITLTHLLAHLSGIVDPPEYWVAAGGTVADLLGPDLFDPAAEPGRFFRYSNLNYGLAATAMERAAGERFDRLAARHALAPIGVSGGFNWSGVGAPARERASPLYRGGPCAWEAQVDGELPADGPTYLGREDGAGLSDYIPGTNGTLFSPQGGLRTSFAGLMAMGRAWLMDASTDPLWDAARDPGDTAGGHFVAFGPGHYIYPPERSPVPGVRLVGHVGEAYGFYGGLWAAPERDAVFAFGQLGSPETGVSMTGGVPDLRATNAAYFARVAEALL